MFWCARYFLSMIYDYVKRLCFHFTIAIILNDGAYLYRLVCAMRLWSCLLHYSPPGSLLGDATAGAYLGIPTTLVVGC